MMASKAGHMECVKVLLDKRAEVNMQNKVSGALCTLCTCNAAWTQSSPVVHDARILFCACMQCYLMTESLDEATSMMVTGFTNNNRWPLLSS